jgi:hypothetical protein
MVSKKTIYGLDFATLKDYFNYIIDSKTNGQQKQAKQLYKDLSTRQKNNFVMYLTQIYTASRTNEIIKYLL